MFSPFPCTSDWAVCPVGRGCPKKPMVPLPISMCMVATNGPQDPEEGVGVLLLLALPIRPIVYNLPISYLPAGTMAPRR